MVDALALAAPNQIGAGCTQNAGVVDAAMLVETVILGCQDGIFHDRWHVLNADDCPTFLAIFADQETVGV
jgi:hypothetical protein